MKATSPVTSRGPSAFATCLLFVVTAAAAFGHPGHGPGGWGAGFIHPLSGWDHALAMIAVGIWAAQIGATWALPAAFLGMMTVGAVLGHAIGPISGIDQAIAASVLALGLLVARRARLPLGVAVTLVGAFALFHGAAHGAEMPATATGALYGLGFLAATALLHAVGVGMGLLATRRAPKLAQAAGWAVAAGGLAIAVGAF